MTKVNENGQLEFTFEELDLEGALQEVRIELDRVHSLWRAASTLDLLRLYNDRYCLLQDIELNIKWLIWKG
jgi:hypothetical protein